MRVIKEPFEINAIAEASDIASRVIEETAKLVKEGVSETDLAAEAYYVAFKQGSEEPHIYINIGPYPRVHAEPTRHARVKNGVLVTIVVGVDYEGYYSNASTTLYVGGSKPEHVSNAFKCAYEVYEEAVNQTKPSVRFVDVMKRLDEIYSRYGLLNSRVKGYLHGVGLQIEEYPITTIVPGHRVAEARAGMVVAMVHSPLMLKGYGSLKIEARSI
ncbi:M24 family metallopeptidase [Desulfurococcus amylolyticus]|uniref:M24 family metallopeptidase n=1 Tax=Desulfurococcus amylolyticus TaxID=94694 RepID=UPI002277352F|nr:M24 family metallopeptidase [Desulfurococcus amylolyticus]